MMVYRRTLFFVFLTGMFLFLMMGSGSLMASDPKVGDSVENSEDAPENDDEENPTVDGKVVWLDYAEAVEKGREENLPVLAVFYNDGCRKCEILEKNGFGRPDISAYVNKKFAPVRINGGEDTGLVKKYRVNAYPTVWFVDSEGKEIDALIGYVKPDKLFLILKYVGDDVYKTKSFSEYEKEQKK